MPLPYRPDIFCNVNATKGTPAKKATAKKVATKSAKKAMSTKHKDALAQGRTEGRIIRMYLEIVEANKPKRGRKRTADSITKRLAAIQKELTTADAIVKLRLTQERMNLTAELATKQLGSDFAKLENQFVKIAAVYSQRNGITYSAWQEMGVQPNVLKRAGINREEL
jgi:hypothetical protein